MGNSCMREENLRRSNKDHPSHHLPSNAKTQQHHEHHAYDQMLKEDREAWLQVKEKRNSNDEEKLRKINDDIENLECIGERTKNQEFQLKKLIIQRRATEKLIDQRNMEINHIRTSVMV